MQNSIQKLQDQNSADRQAIAHLEQEIKENSIMIDNLQEHNIKKPQAPTTQIKAPTSDHVHHPNHYFRATPTIVNGQLQQHSIEPIDFLESLLAAPEFTGVTGWLASQVIKYLARFPMKNGVEDLEKAQVYLQRLIDHEKCKQEHKGDHYD